MNKVSLVMINGIDYIISHRFSDYVYLIEIDNPSNYLIRKIVKTNSGESLEVINDQEYMNALEIFSQNVSIN